ncbi:piggyBac transposable element-derived protein 1-like [Arvicola amphibius]|uniref:piggyBac transposable element-derived protein 1-like n=1 Tax=Arvicola amphibius TaxID=1047088 RepID=UPI001C0832CE|nr:piggyBac transposable element-derived protein 1-like [Arvicola amphibius]
MSEALLGSTPENEDSPVTVKEEETSWEQPGNSQEGRNHTRELYRLRIRQFCYQEALGPREAVAQLWELCHQWLRPDTRSKEQILELVVLEQFLTILPKELRGWVQMYRLQSVDEPATLLENLAPEHGDTGQQRPAQHNRCPEQHRRSASCSYRTEGVRPVLSVLASGSQQLVTTQSDCAPHIPGSTTFPSEKTVSSLNTLKNCHLPRDSWARRHITSLQYAAGDITRRGREKNKSQVSELLQGLAFSDDSEAGEDNEPEVQPERKKLKVSCVPEKRWSKRDIKPSFPSWSALDSGLLNLKSEKLNPIELFELFFDITFLYAHKAKC